MYGFSNKPLANLTSSTLATASFNFSSDTRPRSTASSSLEKLSSHKFICTPALSAKAAFSGKSPSVNTSKRSTATPSAIIIPSKPNSFRRTSFNNHSFAWHGTPSISLYAAIMPVVPASTADFIGGKCISLSSLSPILAALALTPPVVSP